MRLVVLDTNVVISAAIQRNGPPAAIVQEALEGRLQIATCPSVLAEYREVMRRPRLARYGLPPEWLDFLVAQSLYLPEPRPWPLSGPDPDDLVFLALAKAAGAILVTGNLADYPSEIRRSVKVMAPAAFMKEHLDG